MSAPESPIVRRPIRIEGDVVIVPLTRGLEAIVDLQDIELVEQWNWHASPRFGLNYACRKSPRDASGKQKTISLHATLMNPPKGYVVDHIDGNGLNNRRANLRLATHSQNVKNSRLCVKNTSGHKGVVWQKRTKKWRAQINANCKYIHLGFYETIEGAISAYQDASERLHGEYRRVL